MPPLCDRLILSLFDHSGVWSAPYAAAGYRVIRVDIQEGLDVMTFVSPQRPWGVLAAPPCTIWTNAAAHTWQNVTPAEFAYQKSLVLHTLALCRSAQAWWCLENPRGRLPSVIPHLGSHVHEFTPADYGDPWYKRTCLWGWFNLPLIRRTLAAGSLVGGRRTVREYPLFGARDTQAPYHRGVTSFAALTPGQKLERANWRSATPAGFARQFFLANP